MMLIVSFGFLACIILKDPLCIFCFSFCFLLYLNERFHSKRILIVFTILSLFSIVLYYIRNQTKLLCRKKTKDKGACTE